MMCMLSLKCRIGSHGEEERGSGLFDAGGFGAGGLVGLKRGVLRSWRLWVWRGCCGLRYGDGGKVGGLWMLLGGLGWEVEVWVGGLGGWLVIGFVPFLGVGGVLRGCEWLVDL